MTTDSKIYIASSSAGIVPNAHTYIVFDFNGNTNSFSDQFMINAGPNPLDIFTHPPFGSIAILVDEAVQSEN